MLKKILRYYYTVIHLKPIQIRYQIWYRFRNSFFPLKISIVEETLSFKKISLTQYPVEKSSYLGGNQFIFLNIKYNFGEQIDWNYLNYGKLWVYNLNYFEYLHQTSIDKETGFLLISDFIKKINKYSIGLESYPISLRGINWIKFMSVHNHYPSDILKNLKTQYGLLTKKIEYHLLGNHLLENGFSLFIAGIFFYDAKMLKKAEDILSVELNEQILNDGGHFEGSPMYQQILTLRILDCINFASNSNYKGRLEFKLQQVAANMLGWLQKMTFNNGETPHFNDSTYGVTLSTESLVKYASNFDIIPSKLSLSSSGYRKFETIFFELIVDAGGIQPSYQAGHSHNDASSFVLNFNNTPIVVDTGISTYEDNSTRFTERSVTAHNNVFEKGIEPSDLWSSFRVGKREIVSILSETEKAVEIERKSPNPTSEKLVRKFNVSENTIEITDWSNSQSNEKNYFTSIHFHPDVSIVANDNLIINDTIKFTWEGVKNWKLENYKFAIGFNKTQYAKVWRGIVKNKSCLILSNK